MARTFDHGLNVVLPGFFGQFTECFKFRELRLVAGVGDAPGTQSIPKGKAHIVLRENLADIVKTFVEKVLLVMVSHPLGKNRTPAAHDACDALGNHRKILNQHAGVNGHVVDALLGLFLDNFEHDVAVQVFDALHARNRFIDRHGPDRYRRMTHDGFANLVNVAAGREIHYGVGAIVDSGVQLLQFLIDIRCHGGVADVRVDLAERGDADRHRLEFGMIDVGWDDHSSPSNFVPDQFHGLFFPESDVLHLFGDTPRRAYRICEKFPSEFAALRFAIHSARGFGTAEEPLPFEEVPFVGAMPTPS